MNELAQIAYDLVTGKEIDANRLAGLSPEERAALEDLNSLLRHPNRGATRPPHRLVANE